ncbi:MAG: carboxypeptidase-like regulatory domain-containing protein [Bacteroidales bacterium]|nr:carboxypeptidase-like regulatory domain-containing protein [Bacteroidales bacterium]
MKKIFVIVAFLTWVVMALGQSKMLTGTVYDASAVYPIVGVQVQNMNTGQYVFGDNSGNFSIRVSLRDSLLISHAGYRQALVVIDNRDFSRGKKDIILYHKAFMLPNVTIYGLNPTYKGFQRDVANVKLPDSYKNLEDVHLTKEERRNATYTEEAPNVLKGTKVGSPITWLYSAFNKHEKTKRLYYEMESYGDEIQQVPQKYNKELVAEITGLEEPELMDFMMYCRFGYYDLVRWSREKIIDNIKTKFYEYQYYKALEEDDQ